MKISKRIIRVIAMLLIVSMTSGIGVYAASSIGTPQNVLAVQTQNKQLTVTWSKVKNVSGYSVQYRIKGSKWITKNTAKNTITLKGLSEGKTYNVRVIAFKKTNGKKQYGEFSKTQNVKIKSIVVAQNAGTAYCTVCGYGKDTRYRKYNYSNWQIFTHIASKHWMAVLRKMWQLGTTDTFVALMKLFRSNG